MRRPIQLFTLAAFTFSIAAFGIGPAFADDARATQSNNLGDDSAYIKNVDNSKLPNDSGDSKKKRRPGTGAGINPGGDGVIVPEPGTIALLGLGIAGLSLARARKNAKNS